MAKTSADNKYIRSSIENVQTNEITISEDKLRIKLEHQIEWIKRSSGVLSYLSLVITCISILVSTEFKEIHGITPDMWKAFFYLATAAFLALFFVHGFNAIFHRVTVDSIVKDIKTADFLEKEPRIKVWLRKVLSLRNVESDSEEERK